MLVVVVTAVGAAAAVVGAVGVAAAAVVGAVGVAAASEE